MLGLMLAASGAVGQYFAGNLGTGHAVHSRVSRNGAAASKRAARAAEKPT